MSISYPSNITETTSTARVNTPFTIQLTSNPYSNAIWELTLPPQIKLINTNRHFEGDSNLNEWVFNPLTLGNYSITFNYRKQCCGHRILKKVVYHISVI